MLPITRSVVQGSGIGPVCVNVCVLLCYVTVLVSMCVCHVYLINYLLTYLLIEALVPSTVNRFSTLLIADCEQMRFQVGYRRNDDRVDAAVTVGGRQFQALVPAAQKDRSPSVNLRVAGTTNADELEDPRHCRDSNCATCCNCSEICRCQVL